MQFKLQPVTIDVGCSMVFSAVFALCDERALIPD